MTTRLIRVSFVLLRLVVLGLLTTSTDVVAQEKERWQSGKVLSVSADGQVTIRSGKTTISLPLQGVAFPLADQLGFQDSYRQFQRMLSNQTVQYLVVESEKVKYIRVRLGMDWANIKLIELGVAWHDHRQLPSENFAKAQAQAKSLKLGLWKHEGAIPPWEWPQEHNGLFLKQLDEKWRNALSQTSEDERTKAIAIIDRSVLAMGGKEKLRGLSQLHWEFELTFGDFLRPYVGLLIGVKAANIPAETIFNTSLFWTNDEQLRVDIGSTPSLPSAFDPKAMASLRCYWLKDQIGVFYRRQVPGKEPIFVVPPDPGVIPPGASTGPRRARQVLLGLMQLYPLHGDKWLLRMAKPTADDDRPAILVASRDLSLLNPDKPIIWSRFIFNKESGRLAEIGDEGTFLPSKLRFSNYQEFDGLTMWTKVECELLDKMAQDKLTLFSLNTTTLKPLPMIDQAILSLPKAVEANPKANNDE